jgi:hypothetical protein
LPSGFARLGPSEMLNAPQEAVPFDPAGGADVVDDMLPHRRPSAVYLAFVGQQGDATGNIATAVGTKPFAVFLVLTGCGSTGNGSTGLQAHKLEVRRACSCSTDDMLQVKAPGPRVGEPTSFPSNDSGVVDGRGKAIQLGRQGDGGPEFHTLPTGALSLPGPDRDGAFG